MKRVVVNVSDEMFETLQHLAEREVRSIPNLVLWLAQKSLSEKEQQQPKAS